MNGFVSHEREKFERIAREMQDKDKDLVYMDSKLRKVQELIKNSPVVQSRRVPLKDSTAHNENTSDEKVQYSNRMSHAPPSCFFSAWCYHFIYDYAMQGGNVPPLKGKNSRKRSLSENWLEHKPTTTVNSGALLQPVYKKKKTVTNPQPRDLQSQQMNKYCLQHQEEDSQGAVKTSLYKVSYCLLKLFTGITLAAIHPID